MNALKFYEFEDLVRELSSKERTPKQVIHELIDETRDFHQEITLRPSGLTEFSDNSLAWATKQLLGVHYPSSYSTIIGDICHEAADLCYTHVIEHGQIPSIRTALIAGVKKGRFSYYRSLPKALRDPTRKSYSSLKSIYQEAKVMFSIYYDQIIPYQHPLACEHKMSYRFVDDLGDPLNIKLEGTFDRLEEGDIIVDLKTSKSNITGEILTDARLDDLKEQLKAANARPLRTDERSKLEDIVKLSKRRPSKTQREIDIALEIKEQKRVLRLKRSTDEEKAKAEALLLSLDNDLQAEIENIGLSHAKTIAEAEERLSSYLSDKAKKRQEKIDALEQEIAPLQADLDRRQHANDCLQAKRKHGKQLAAYALLYMLIYGKKVTQARIELLVRRKKGPFVKSLQFTIEDEINKLIDDIDELIEIITSWRNGTPSRVLFRSNPETFRGSDLTELIDTVMHDDDKKEDPSDLSSAA